jgi:hypothetical protein
VHRPDPRRDVGPPCAPSGSRGPDACPTPDPAPLPADPIPLSGVSDLARMAPSTGRVLRQLRSGCSAARRRRSEHTCSTVGCGPEVRAPCEGESLPVPSRRLAFSDSCVPSAGQRRRRAPPPAICSRAMQRRCPTPVPVPTPDPEAGPGRPKPPTIGLTERHPASATTPATGDQPPQLRAGAGGPRPGSGWPGPGPGPDPGPGCGVVAPVTSAACLR